MLVTTFWVQKFKYKSTTKQIKNTRN